MTSNREWVWVQSPSGRESAFTRVRHVIVEPNNYSGFGITACGKESREPWGSVTDLELTDPNGFYVQNHIPADLCKTCDKRTR